jgi:hypothetical protein
MRRWFVILSSAAASGARYGEAVRFQVHVPTPGAGGVSRFEIERAEAPKPGDILDLGTMAYKVTRVVPSSGEFDGIVEAEWMTGPGRSG